MLKALALLLLFVVQAIGFTNPIKNPNGSDPFMVRAFVCLYQSHSVI
jgi:hypothetical protein